MSPTTTHTVAGIRVLVAEADCVCGHALVLVQLPGAKLTHEDAVCGRCVSAVRRVAAA